MVKLGEKVTDAVTGFTGIAVSRITYLTGVDQIGVQARCIDNKPRSVIFFDEEKLLANVKDLAMMKHGGEVET